MSIRWIEVILSPMLGEWLATDRRSRALERKTR
jgi:hypothetical protein